MRFRWPRAKTPIASWSPSSWNSGSNPEYRTRRGSASATGPRPGTTCLRDRSSADDRASGCAGEHHAHVMTARTAADGDDAVVDAIDPGVPDADPVRLVQRLARRAGPVVRPMAIVPATIAAPMRPAAIAEPDAETGTAAAGMEGQAVGLRCRGYGGERAKPDQGRKSCIADFLQHFLSPVKGSKFVYRLSDDANKEHGA